MNISEIVLHPTSLWMFYLCMFLGLLLHVLLKMDAWYKPDKANRTAPCFKEYFLAFPFRTAISVLGTLLVGLLMWEYQIRDAIAGAAAGYMGNSILDALLGQRTAVK